MAPYGKILSSVLASTVMLHAEAASSLRGGAGVVSEESVVVAKDWAEGDENPSWYRPRPEGAPCSDEFPCQFIMIADLDSDNRTDKGKKMKFESAIMRGKLAATDSKYIVSFDEEVVNLSTKYNEGGRGSELSELSVWDNKWITADDRTGIVFQIQKQKSKLLPRFIFNEGDGSSSAKGFKIEWMTQKGDELYIGSHGNPRRDDEGVMGSSLKWVMIASKDGSYKRVDWSNNYQKIADTLGAGIEGYLTNEAIEWSDILKKWVILPRRLSKEAFDEKTDDIRGTNMMAMCSEDFSQCDAVEVAGLETANLKGFASFKFVPNTGDKVIAALRSAEDNTNNTQSSYVSVFTTEGKILVPEVQVPNAKKLEGFTFV